MRQATSWFLLVLLVLLLPAVVQAQEPTDRPFPGAQVTATDRPFPGAAATAISPTAEATTQPEEASATPELASADIQATASAALAQVAQLESERDALQVELEAAQSDNAATTFAIVIIVVGVLLAFAVFFGLRRSGE